MRIIIPLPQSSSINTYKELMGYLKQFELAIHHAQKAVENAEKTGIVLTEDTFITFRHPQLDDVDLKDINCSFNDMFYEESQQIELDINLQ